MNWGWAEGRRQGQIVEQGSHDELLAQSGLYNELYQRQFLSGAKGAINFCV
jgi:hypothetical protein